MRDFVIVISCVLCCTTLSCSPDPEIYKWGDRFYAPKVKKGDSIIAFSMNLIQNKKRSQFTLNNQADRDALYSGLRNSTVPFLTMNTKGLRYHVDYSCTFSDGAKLQYAATLDIFKKRTYLYLLFPEDVGFQGDGTVDVQLEGVLSKKTIESLRNKFLDGAEPPVFKPVSPES